MVRGLEHQLRALSWSLVNVPVGQEGVISVTCVPARTTERRLGSRVYPGVGGGGIWFLRGRGTREGYRRIVL